MRRTLASIILASAALCLAHLQAGADEKSQQWIDAQLSKLCYEDGIVYKSVDGRELKLCLFKPENAKPGEKLPFMVFTHGGGWKGGDRFDKILTPVSYGALRQLGQSGIACASVEYRLLSKDGKERVVDCATDCKDAVRFLVKNADKLGLDPERMGIWGDSAGGQLCLTTALAPDAALPGDPALKGDAPKFRCVVADFPITSFVNPELHVGTVFAGSFKRQFDGPWQDRKEEAELLSPTTHIGKNSPPILLLHGDSDKIVSLRNSEYLQKLGAERGADVKLVVVKNADHGFSGKNLEPSMDEINKLVAAFIVEKLKR